MAPLPYSLKAQLVAQPLGSLPYLPYPMAAVISTSPGVLLQPDPTSWRQENLQGSWLSVSQ